MNLSDTTPVSLRERKKLATRAALIATARRLFAEKGYEKTTLEEICKNVQIHITTFFSYFESKEELAFARTIENLQHFRQELRDRPPGTDVMTLWWHFVSEFSVSARAEESAIMARMDQIPELRGRYANIIRDYEAELARALAEEAGTDPTTDLFSRLKSAVILAAMVAGGRWYVDVFGDESVGVDSIIFTKKIIEEFPKRSVFLALQKAFSTQVRKKVRAKNRMRKRPS